MTPPATASLDLVPPGPALPVAPEEAEAGIAVAAGVAARIDSMVASFIAAIASLDPHDEEYGRRIAEVGDIGEREILATSEMSHRLLDRPVRAMGGMLEGRSPVAKDLAQLRQIVADLDPARWDLARTRSRRRLGILPAGDRLRGYFDRFEKAQGRIGAIIRALSERRNELRADSAAIAQEERALWTEMETLRQYAYLARAMDEALERHVDAVATSDPARARTLRTDMQFPVRQRLQDILTQLAVATQGYAALRVVQQNNHDVIRAIQTATTTTMAALRTAVMVAGALTDQRLTLDQVAATNEAAAGMIESAAALAKRQAAIWQAQARGTGRDLSALQQAWDEVATTLDQIDSYKSTALETMQVTVRELSGQVQRSRASLEQLERARALRASLAEARPEPSMLRIS